MNNYAQNWIRLGSLGEERVIGHAFDAASVHEHDRVEPAEGLPVIGG